LRVTEQILALLTQTGDGLVVPFDPVGSVLRMPLCF